MKIWTAPDGTRLLGTKESIPGIAEVHAEKPINDDGTPNYDGGTTMDWDESKTVERGGQIVWVDVDGEEWLTSELVETEVSGEDAETE